MIDRCEQEVVRILRKRRACISKEVVQFRIRWQDAEKKMKEVITSEEGRKAYSQLAASVRCSLWQRGKKKDQKKIAHAIRKVKQRYPPKPASTGDSYKLSDSDLDAFATEQGESMNKPCNYVEYGNVSLDDDEKHDRVEPDKCMIGSIIEYSLIIE